MSQDKARIVIEYDFATDDVTVEGPLSNKTLCYAMLERAKDSVRDYQKREQHKLTVVPNGRGN